MVGGVGYEVTTYRTEGSYSDHRHPDGVCFVRSLREDLARRDFTINAMAYHPEMGVVDLFGGQEDLRNGVLRCVGKPEERFEEDALRILRLLRFSARFGFAIHPDTGRAALEQRDGLDYIAQERIFAELKGLLVGNFVLPVLRDYREILAQFLPELRPMFGFAQHNPHHCYDVWMHTAHAVAAVEPEETLRLCMLFHDIGKPDCFRLDENGVGHFHGHPVRSAEIAETCLDRLKCDHKTKEDVLALIRWHDRLRVFSKENVRQALIGLGERRGRLLLKVVRADVAGKKPELFQREQANIAAGAQLMEQLLAEGLCLSVKDLHFNGRDAMALGCQGTEIGWLLNALLSEVQEEKLPNDRAALEQRGRLLLREKKDL
jgi:tRNA nucleotidyltransferase (CCA-adding enzyme)